jgi:hypothetical protein
MQWSPWQDIVGPVAIDYYPAGAGSFIPVYITPLTHSSSVSYTYRREDGALMTIKPYSELMAAEMVDGVRVGGRWHRTAWEAGNFPDGTFTDGIDLGSNYVYRAPPSVSFGQSMSFRVGYDSDGYNNVYYEDLKLNAQSVGVGFNAVEIRMALIRKYISECYSLALGDSRFVGGYQSLFFEDAMYQNISGPAYPGDFKDDRAYTENGKLSLNFPDAYQDTTISLDSDDGFGRAYWALERRNNYTTGSNPFDIDYWGAAGGNIAYNVPYSDHGNYPGIHSYQHDGGSGPAYLVNETVREYYPLNGDMDHPVYMSVWGPDILTILNPPRLTRVKNTALITIGRLFTSGYSPRWKYLMNDTGGDGGGDKKKNPLRLSQRNDGMRSVAKLDQTFSSSTTEPGAPRVGFKQQYH